MSFTPDRIQTIGWAEEVTEGTDPVAESYSYYYHFGQLPRTPGDFPNLSQDVHPTYRGDSRDPAHLEIFNSRVESQIAFVPINGVPFWMMLGADAYNAGHVMTGIDIGELPTYTIRWKTDNGTTAVRKAAKGVKFQQLSLQLQNNNTATPMTMAMSYQGIDFGDVTYDGDVSRTYPGNGTTPYMWDTTYGVFEWDSDAGTNGSGDNVDYAADLVSLHYTLLNQNQFFGKVGQDLPEYLFSGQRMHTLEFTLRRGNDTSIYDDYLTQGTNNTFHDLRFKIANSADGSDYMQIVFNQVGIVNVDMNMANVHEGQEPTYRVTAVCQDIEVKVVDALEADYDTSFTA